MRPIRLELEGFTCFKKKAEIDFKDLDLFAITGPTGSGKTSLLDAIIFALYGRTPRLGFSQASDLISQGMLRLSVLLEFRASGRRWRIARTIRHIARSSPSKAQMEVFEKGEWKSRSSAVKQIRGMVENIVGLDFDGFTKSVVLPQGEFDRFLKGTPSERRRILTELLGLHIYEEMGKRAREIAEIARTSANVKQEQLEKSYADATPKARKELKKQLGQLQEEADELAKRLKSIQQAQPLAQSLGGHQSKLQEIDEEIAETSKELEGQEEELKKVEESLQKQQDEMSKLEKELAESGYDEERFLRLTQLESKAEEWQRLTKRLASREEEIADRRARQNRLEEQRVQAEKALQASQQALEQACEEEGSRREELTQAVERHGSTEAVSQILRQAGDLADLREELAKRREQLKETRSRQSETAQQLESAEKQLAQAEDALQKATRAFERLRRLHSAEDLRRHLEEGQPCPVCLQEVSELPGQIEHPGLEETERAQKEARQEQQEIRDRISRLKSEKQSLPRQLETLEQAVEDPERRLEAVESRIEETLGRSPKEYPSASLRQLLDRLKDLEEKAGESTRKREAQEKETSRQNQLVQQAVHNLELEAKEAEALEVRQSEDRGRLKALGDDFSEWLEKDESLKDFLSQLQIQWKARDLSRKLEEEISSRRERGHELAAGVQRLKDRLESGSERLATLQGRRKSEEKARRKAEEELNKALQTLFEDLPLFQEGQEPKTVEDDPARQLEQERIEVEARLNELRSQTARGEERLEQLQQRIQQARQLRKEIKEEKENASVARELGLVLRANQLISFVQEEAFRRLAEDGTRHLLQLSSQRYSFEVEGDHFAVLDHWNADEARPVNTLSGGESFLASLALALALAESLTDFVSDRQELSLDSLFLDEGFSTLDQETLDVVVQSVETLAGGDRLIGVISHVPELAERFPSRIQVSKSIAGSSIEVE